MKAERDFSSREGSENTPRGRLKGEESQDIEYTDHRFPQGSRGSWGCSLFTQARARRLISKSNQIHLPNA